MYPGKHAKERAHQPAFIMAGSGEAVSYAEYEARTNRLAHLLRRRRPLKKPHPGNFRPGRPARRDWGAPDQVGREIRQVPRTGKPWVNPGRAPLRPVGRAWALRAFRKRPA